MARITKPAEILGAVRQRLIDSQVFTAKNCLIAQPEQAWQSPPGDVWAAVWLDGGAFDPEQIDGNVPMAKSSVAVTLFSRVLLDPAGSDEATATDSERGLLVLADKVFQKLFLHDLADVDAVPLLAEPMRPTGFSRPERLPDSPGSISMAWEVVFEWEVDE